MRTKTATRRKNTTPPSTASLIDPKNEISLATVAIRAANDTEYVYLRMSD
jgi:hypothetical protein